MKTLLDANACLHYLLNDIEEQANITANAIAEGSEVTLEVLAEIVYVLDGVYNITKPLISKTLIEFLGEVSCLRDFVAVSALEFYSENNLDFVDCILLAENQINKRIILTFDKKLKRKLS